VTASVSGRPSRPSAPPRLLARYESTGLSLGAHDKLRAAVLSGVAGYVDAAGLLSLAAMFPAHITGELVTEAVAFSSAHQSPGSGRLWVLPAFVLAVALAAVVARIERRARRAPMPSLLLLLTLGLAVFTLSGLLVRLWPGVHVAAIARVEICSAVAAMGFQNAMMRESLLGSAPTTFMTGNLTQVVIELVDHVLSIGRPPGILGDVQRSVSRARLKTAGIALASFLLSAAIGAYLTRGWGALSAALPTLLVGLLSLQAFRERRAKPTAAEQSNPTVGMRRPTPMPRPLAKQPRLESGTRFKAVRPPSDEQPAEPKKAEEESA
jgi:uncharacterized membrane protein YoaK (UPF0700 family)